jgi:3-oxoacyl-[acyl-carrier-protein] synthase I
MRKVWIVADSVVSPLGLTSLENYCKIMDGAVSVRQEVISAGMTACLSRFSPTDEIFIDGKTHFESLALKALQGLKEQVGWPSDRTLFILSTTKGNIEYLENGKPENAGLFLHEVAYRLARQTGAGNHLVVSNACTSGVAALLVACRYLQSGTYDHAVVIGADVISQFVLAGFQCLMALSPKPCKPFDATREGINLGEAAAAIFLTTTPGQYGAQIPVAILGGALSNDANHISGPSKTGVELSVAIRKSLKEAQIEPEEIGFISAHGTGTLYNDEMEAKAFNLSGMKDIPLHSLKGYLGHTLGAAGIVETAMIVQSLRAQELIASAGFHQHGVSMPLNICVKKEKKAMRFALKTASGFGGTNAAMVVGI